MANKGLGSDKQQKHEIIGRILKAHREEKKITQREITVRLGLRNANYISMLENNGSTIPLSRVADLVGAYEIDKNFAFVILHEIYPDVLSMMMKLAALVDLNAHRKDLVSDAWLEKTFQKFQDKYHVH